MKEKIYTTFIKGKSYDLWISDEPEFIRECAKRQVPVIEYIHEAAGENNGFNDDVHSDASGSFLTPWAADSVEAVRSDPEYMEKVLHRFAGEPLVVAENDDLIIRELCESDAESAERIFNEGGASGFVDIWSDSESDRKKALREYCLLHYDLYGYGYYGVEIKGENVLAGIIGFREYKKNAGEITDGGRNKNQDDYLMFVIKGRNPEEIPLELGYVMGEKYRRKGYCISACLELIKKIPGDVYIVVDKNNIPGIRAAKRISGH